MISIEGHLRLHGNSKLKWEHKETKFVHGTAVSVRRLHQKEDYHAKKWKSPLESLTASQQFYFLSETLLRAYIPTVSSFIYRPHTYEKRLTKLILKEYDSVQTLSCTKIKTRLPVITSSTEDWSTNELVRRRLLPERTRSDTTHFSVLGDNSSEISEVKGISQRAIFRQRWVASLKSIWAWKPSQRQTSNSRDEAEGGGKPSLPKRDGLYEQGAGS